MVVKTTFSEPFQWQNAAISATSTQISNLYEFGKFVHISTTIYPHTKKNKAVEDFVDNKSVLWVVLKYSFKMKPKCKRAWSKPDQQQWTRWGVLGGPDFYKPTNKTDNAFILSIQDHFISSTFRNFFFFVQHILLCKWQWQFNKDANYFVSSSSYL